MRKVLIFLCFSAGGVLIQILMERIFEYITGYKSNFPSYILGFVGYAAWSLIWQIYDKIISSKPKKKFSPIIKEIIQEPFITNSYRWKKGKQSNKDDY